MINVKNNSLYKTLSKDNKEKVNRIESMLNSGNPNTMASSPTILLIGEEGSGYMSLTKIIHSIVGESVWLDYIHGTPGELELAFPKGNPELENQFFDSPSRAAIFRNQFYGTMFISFKDYYGEDLINSDSFTRLLSFVLNNKARVKFIFHVSPKFKAIDLLKAHLSSVVNVLEIELLRPDDSQSYSYVMRHLQSSGYEITDEVSNLLKREISKFTKQDYFVGYPSLVNIVDRIDYNMGVSENDERVIDKKFVKQTFKSIQNNQSIIEDTPKKIVIGFSK